MQVHAVLFSTSYPTFVSIYINASYETIAHGITVNFYSVDEVLNFFI